MTAAAAGSWHQQQQSLFISTHAVPTLQTLERILDPECEMEKLATSWVPCVAGKSRRSCVWDTHTRKAGGPDLFSPHRGDEL